MKINYTSRIKSFDILKEIGENSTKIITFIDLAGHQKYLKTTISALTGRVTSGIPPGYRFCKILWWWVGGNMADGEKIEKGGRVKGENCNKKMP